MTVSPSDELKDALRRHVKAVQGPREHRYTPGALQRCENYVAAQLEEVGLTVRREPFVWRGRWFENVVGSLEPDSAEPDSATEADPTRFRGNAGAPAASVGPVPREQADPPPEADVPRFRGNVGTSPAGPTPNEPKRLLLGAHLDTVPGSPGADDNGSGLAGLIEAARTLVADPPSHPVDFVAFHLEEFQKTTYRVGSRHFMKQARKEGRQYSGALVYDMIGYQSTAAESQVVPKILRWKGIPTTGDFIAAVGDRSAGSLVDQFTAACRSPFLPIDPLIVPAKGWIVLVTRRSDNASFWDHDVPAVLISDTANLRNPNYHRATDRAGTLDYDFMARVVTATAAVLRG